MPHVITQSCCSDGSCVYACPVNCIHPSPDEPGFATAEMLYIDPVACVDCGACVSACPVGAIAPDSRLEPEQLPFVELNAAFYPKRETKLPPTSKLAPVIDAPLVRPRSGGPLTVAVVGSGPAAMYAADELLTQQGVRVNVFERLPTPYGLVRAGVAPDHQSTKRVTTLFDKVTRLPGFTFYLNVEVGSDLTHAELLAHHHAVLYAVGAPNDRRLDIEGMDLPGTGTATEMVAWINGHPEFTDLPVDLGHERVVVIGNGNVALDVARILTTDPDALARTDISDHALAALRDSKVTEVVIAARRGPVHSAFTLPELIGLTSKCDVVLDAADHDLVVRDLAVVSDPLTRNKLEILSKLGRWTLRAGARVTAAHPTGVPADPESHSRRATRRGRRVHGDGFRRGSPSGCRAGVDLNRIPRQADSRSAVRRGHCGGTQRRRPGHRSGVGRRGARQLRRRLDQTRPHRLHRHQQVVRRTDRAQPGRRLQRGSARRPRG